MFLVDNSIPFRNATLIQGHFQVASPKLVPGDQLLAEKDGQRVGLVKFIGIINANFSHNPENPRYHISVAFDGDYRLLTGATLRHLKP